MRVFVLAIAALVILHGCVESKNATAAATTTSAAPRGRRTTPKPTPTLSSTTKQTKTTPTVGTKAPTASSTTTKTTKAAGSDREARGKRTLEFGNYGNYIQGVPSQTAQRRVSHAYQDPGQYSHYQSNYIQPQFSYQTTHHQTPAGPGVQYQGFDVDSSNAIGSFQSLPPVSHPHYIEPPEPIIEIIIKESNESEPLAAQLVLPRQKKKKEEVQVFYVKYHKDETNGQLVLDDPLPAIKPIPDESEEEHEEDPTAQEPIVVTAAPPLKTTTLRAVINPDSEKYHSNSGIRISFGVEDRHQSGHQISESESESVAQPILALPQHAPEQHRAKADVFFQQHQQFVQQQHDRSVRQHYQQAQPPQQPPPHHHQPQFQQGPVVQQYQHHQHQQPQQPQQYRAQPPPPPPPPQPQPQPHHHQQQQYQPQPQQHYQHQPQHYQPQPQRVTYNQPPPPPPPPPQPQPQVQPQPQYQYRGQFAQPQPQPQQPQYYQPQPQPRPQQIRFPPPPPPPPQAQQAPQVYYQPQQPPQQQQQQPPQFQRQEYQQPKPIPIPLHNINQQPPLRQQYAPQPQPQQFNQPFNNFYKPQPPQPQPQPSQQQPPQQQFRKPAPPPPPPPPPPPSPQQQPPFLSQRPQQQPQQQLQQERPNVGQRGSFFDSARPVQGGLVQQAAPNLGPTRAPERPTSSLSDKEHLANLKHVLPAGGELVASVSKYEKHITETVNGQRGQPQQQQQQQVSSVGEQNRPPYYNILPSQELISHSVEPTIENVPQSTRQNIGPLASNIGPLPVPQRYVSQQAAQVIPNSQPINLSPRFAGASTPQPPTSGTTRTTYSPTFSTTPRTTTASTARPTTTLSTTTETATTSSAVSNEKQQKALFDLPDEVPDDLRAQLLSSGILENADISVLDYDKIGETALENLPAEHLANFFNAGGGSQLAGSSNVLSVVRPDEEKFITRNYETKGKRDERLDERDRYEVAGAEQGAEEPSAIVTMPERQQVDLKVVRFDAANQKNVTDRYIQPDSTVLPSVDATQASSGESPIFNRYLPLKLNGAQFPIPDAVELRGRRIASVVVLAPVDGGLDGRSSEEGAFLINAEEQDSSDRERQPEQSSRFERDVLLDSKRIRFVAGEALKQLIKKPSRENFRRWLEREGKTDVDLQSVVLLVTRNENNEQEIFMYDIATKGVTHLSGELSAAFVQVAEENAQTQNFDEVASVVDTGIVEQMDPKAPSDADYGSGSYSDEEDEAQEAQASDRQAVYVYPENYRGLEVSSGYSNIKK